MSVATFRRLMMPQGQMLAVCVALLACAPQPAVTSLPVPAPTVTTAKDQCPAGLVFVAGGRFRATTAVTDDPDDIDVASLCVDAHETTVQEYATAVSAAVCERPLVPAHCTWSRGNGSLPMNCVSKNSAAQYCKWRAARLPTVHEQEWIARAEVAMYGRCGTPCAVPNEPCVARETGRLSETCGHLAEWSVTVGPPGKDLAHGGTYLSVSPVTPSMVMLFPSGQEYPMVGFRCVRP